MLAPLIQPPAGYISYLGRMGRHCSVLFVHAQHSHWRYDSIDTNFYPTWTRCATAPSWPGRTTIRSRRRQSMNPNPRQRQLCGLSCRESPVRNLNRREAAGSLDYIAFCRMIKTQQPTAPGASLRSFSHNIEDEGLNKGETFHIEARGALHTNVLPRRSFSSTACPLLSTSSVTRRTLEFMP
jgi:hypothetical protein